MYYPNGITASLSVASTIAFETPPAQKTIGSSLIGNLGAPLCTDDHVVYDGDSDHEIHLSDDPFSFGLASGPELELQERS